jgi:hypothetical protein
MSKSNRKTRATGGRPASTRVVHVLADPVAAKTPPPERPTHHARRGNGR